MYNNFSEFLPKNGHTEKLITDVKHAASEYMSAPIESLEHSKFEYVIKTGKKREVYEDDGCCKEGALYWTYAFVFFVIMQSLYANIQMGKLITSLFQRSKKSSVQRKCFS